MPQKALFLDRDGIINQDKRYVFQPEAFEWQPGILDLCRWAREEGFLLIAITNQSGVARGYFSLAQMHTFHHFVKMQFDAAGLELTDIYYCPHHPSINGACLCRKPGSLLIEKALAKYGLSAELSIMIGDKSSDALAGLAAGCRAVWVHPSGPDQGGITRVPDLFQCLEFLKQSPAP